MTWLTNAWYVAALDEEVSQTPLVRTFLDTPILLYRTADGRPVALHDRCPHRFVPLSMGRICGDDVMCIYHGLRFGPDGLCTHNPHSAGAIPAALRIDSFSVVERSGFLWIWLGEPGLADPDLIEPVSFIDDNANFAYVRGYLTVDAHYELITDNLLDLSHVETLHPLFATEQGVTGHRTECWQQDGTVFANRRKPASTVNAFARLMWDTAPVTGDARANMRWQAPARLDFDLGVTECGRPPEEGLCTPAVHLLTPATATHTHYFWAQGRNRKIEDSELSLKIAAVTDKVFRTEDKPVIEAQQAAMGSSTDLMAMKPMLLGSDAPPIRARRILKERISATH